MYQNSNLKTSLPAKRNRFLVSFCLFTLTLALYWPATSYNFVSVDDDQYAYENPAVTAGLHWKNIGWAFTSTHAANWHPLTWLTHMLDYSLFRSFAGGHHLTNIILHSLNSVMLFLLLCRLTKNFWPCALVAALFAWHPVHVESVAWISERKDVLSTLFFLLTLWAYARYAERTTFAHYSITLLMFTLGLMAKPMLVTLPCVLMLMDYWPLQRFGQNGESTGSTTTSKSRLLFEKIPFFALSIAACVVTIIAQRSGGAIKSTDDISFAFRIMNSLRAYALYILKTVYPVDLAVFYPLPLTISLIFISLVALALITASWIAFRRRNSSPWMLVGWLWFIGTLVPVIGLIQVGNQAMADRYSYIPSIGLFIMLAWGLSAWSKVWPSVARCAGVTMAVALVLCMGSTRHQLSFWQNSIVLFSHALDVTPSNAFSENNLGAALSHAGRGAEAIPHYKAVLNFRPDDVKARYNLGIEYAAIGRLDDAANDFSEALKRQPDSDLLHNNLGVVLARKNQIAPAIEQFKQAILANPTYPKPYFNCAMALQKQGKGELARDSYEQALKLEPIWPEALDHLAFLFANCPEKNVHDPAKSLAMAQHLNDLTGKCVPRYLKTLAMSYAADEKFSNAVSIAEMAVKRAHAKGSKTPADKIESDLASYRTGRMPLVDWTNTTAFEIQR